MSNPTSNFGWQMPTATDLVTDLPADFEVFGQAVDTDFVDLLGGTTGQILSKTSATDLDFTWIANDQGDITGVTAGNGISVTDPTGPVPTVAINTAVTADLTTAQTLTNKKLSDSTTTIVDVNDATKAIKFDVAGTTAVTGTIATAFTTAKTVTIPDTTGTVALTNGVINNTLTTTTGDIIYASAANTPARLGIGTTGQNLVVAAGVPSWATPASGSLTLLSTTTLSGASTTISIAAGYKNLQIEAVGVTNSTADGRFKITPNASTTITDGAGLDLINTISISLWDMQNFIGSTQSIQARANADNATLLNIYNYASTSDYKNFNYTSGFLDTGGAQRANAVNSGTIRTASAISSMKFENTGGNFAGGTVRIYGVN